MSGLPPESSGRCKRQMFRTKQPPFASTKLERGPLASATRTMPFEDERSVLACIGRMFPIVAERAIEVHWQLSDNVPLQTGIVAELCMTDGALRC